jgi:1-acyl-sn-glycerol-3-phosphate acyltransferase
MHMGHFRPGIGLLAQALKVPVVPVKLEGLYELKSRQQYFANPGMVRVHIGAAITIPSDETPNAVTEELERRFTSLA